MKKLITAAVCVAIALAAFVALPADAADKPRIAILEIKNKADNQYWWHGGGEAAQDVFITQLVKSGKFTVVERERINAILEEKGLVLSGDINPSTAMQIGQLLGADYLLAGAVTEYGMEEAGAHGRGIRGVPGFNVGKKTFTAAMNARVFDVSTGEILWADEAQAADSSVKVSVGGFGGGNNDRRMFDKVMRPVIDDLVASLRAADL
ncbi:MAG TPA: CsgG/HfaB family protein [Thermoanaerobaculia bacterium]|nr:CsgG/HfaB family protein [Thermoanaerobaculia bacterium]